LSRSSLRDIGPRDDGAIFPADFIYNPVVRLSALSFVMAVSLCAQVGADNWPFVHPHDDFNPSALLDLRSLNEPVAGQSGFVRISADGQFLRGDGTPIRFWACGSTVFTDNPKALPDHARFLAKLGVNMVRLHAQVGPDSNADDPGIDDANLNEIDDIFRAVAAFKRQGIYVTISPYWAVNQPATRWGIEGYDHQMDLWGLLFFNPELQAAYKGWVRKLYATTNPYTGIPLCQDPSVAIIQIQNEDGMFFWTMDAMQPAQKRILGKKFADWLIAKYGSLDATRDAWKYASVKGDDFPAGEIGICSVGLWSRPQHGGMVRRLADQLQFFADTQRNFYANMVRFYRDELGCRQLINASNWITADPIRLNDVERYTDTAADVLAVNKYFTGVHEGKNNGWRVDPGDCFTDHPGVLNPWDLPTNLKQAAGRPMIVTESSWVSPMDFQNEGPFLMAAYQSLTGVAGYFWFAATADQYDDDPQFNFLNIRGQHPYRKWTCSIPALMGNFPAAAIAYRNGFIRRGDPVVVENRPLADLWKAKAPLIVEGATFDPNRMSGEPAGPGQTQSVDPLAFLVGPVTVKYGGDPRDNHIADLSSFIDRGRKTIASNTGQLRMDYGTGLCTIDAPAAQGASGFLSGAGKIHLSTIDLASQNRQASVWVVSMDGKPIAESRKILVQVGTPSRLAGWDQEPTDFPGKDAEDYHGFKIASTGQPPWNCEDADVDLTIRNPNLSTATALDVGGYASKNVPLETANASIQMRFPADAMYAILH
jgi:hypothetical protein